MIDRVLRIQPIHNQLFKPTKKLRRLKSLFIYPYSPKKESLLKELRATQDKIAGLKRKYEDILTLRRYLRIYVLSNTPQKVEIRLKKIKRLRIKYKDKKKIYNLLTNLIKYKDNIFAHLKTPFLPSTNNQLENLIKQYERRLKTIEGFGKNKQAVEGYLNLMAICYCFSARGGSAFGRKPHTDSRGKNKYKNGKFPFPPKVPPEVDSPQAKDLPRAEELAGVSIKGLD